MKIYTKTGDQGETSLFSGKRVAKTHDLVRSFGLLDELNTEVGFLVASSKKAELEGGLTEILFSCQNQIFSVGSFLAGEFQDKTQVKDADSWILKLEKSMDEMTAELPPLKNFILPGGSEPSCFAHKCRVQTRNVERHVVSLEEPQALDVVRYLNRLSDYFFTLARWINFNLMLRSLFEVLDSIKDIPKELNLVGGETSLSGSFLDVNFEGGALKYYSQFGTDVQERFLKNTKGEILAKALCYTKEFYEKDRGAVKALIVTDVKTLNSREALLGWSDFLLPDILKIKKETGADYALFFLSRRQRGVFDFFIRPRKVRADQIRFSHLRGAGVQIVQGQKFFSEEPLEHIQIRRAHEEDIPALKSFIKASSADMPLSRKLSDDNFFPELSSWRGFGLENLAIALDSEDKIVGSLGAFDLSSQGDCTFKFDEVLDPTFVALQGFLKTLSWVTDLRPVLEKQKQSVKFFTHMYFNNHDIFYSMICWWLKRTKQEKTIFLYPSYTGDLKAFPPNSLFSSVFKGDLYLVQSDKGLPSELLKPAHFSTALDIDLPLIL